MLLFSTNSNKFPTKRLDGPPEVKKLEYAIVQIQVTCPLIDQVPQSHRLGQDIKSRYLHWKKSETIPVSQKATAAYQTRKNSRSFLKSQNPCQQIQRVIFSKRKKKSNLFLNCVLGIHPKLGSRSPQTEPKSSTRGIYLIVATKSLCPYTNSSGNYFHGLFPGFMFVQDMLRKRQTAKLQKPCCTGSKAPFSPFKAV